MLSDSNLLLTTILVLFELMLIVGGAISAYNKLNKRLDRIEYQLYNNGGESMKDAVDRIETELIILKTKLGE
jgi:chitinase